MRSNLAGLHIQIEHRVHPGLRLDLCLTLESESTILFGDSGAGKLTILRLIAGLTTPDQGLIRLGDSNLFDSSLRIDMPLRKRRIGLIFQDDLLFPHLNVEQNVRFGLKGSPRREAETRLREIAHLCGITTLLERAPSTLSGGERQRVGLARALAPRPRLLLCDEPVSALDLDARQALIDRIKAVQRAESIPILYVTHSPAEAVALGSRMLQLSGGRISAEGSPLDVLAGRSNGDSVHLHSIRNVFRATIEEHDPRGFSTTLRIDGGPTLVVAKLDRPAGAALNVAIGADEIVLSRGPIDAISARNLIDGTVECVVTHGPEAEVLIKTGDVTWVVGVVPGAIESLDLIAGTEVRMIIKARSCQILGDEVA